MILIILGWVLFRSDTIGDAWTYLGAMFGFVQGSGVRNPLAIYLDNKAMVEIGAAIILAMPICPFLSILKNSIPAKIPHLLGSSLNAGAYLLRFLFIVAVVYADIISLAAGVYNPFIYFRF